MQYSHHDEITEIFFVDELNGWAVGFGRYTMGSIIYKTTDGGLNWDEQIFLAMNFNCLHFTDSLNGWVAGYDCLFNTTDGGTSWIDKSESLPDQFNAYGIYFANVNKGWLVGGKGILRTSDRGNLWFYKDTEEFVLYTMFNSWMKTLDMQRGIPRYLKLQMEVWMRQSIFCNRTVVKIGNHILCKL